jgi:hypothetical protein
MWTGGGRFRLRKEEERKTYEDTRTWNLLGPIRYRPFGSFSTSLGYDSLKLQHQGHTRLRQAMLPVQQE